MEEERELKDEKYQKHKYNSFIQKWGQAVNITGRVILNLWNIMRKEINLTNYELDHLCYHILKKRQPKFSYDTLTQWWFKGLHYNVTNYILRRMQMQFEILDTLDIINRDMNMAKVYGIDYESIMT